MGSFLVEKVTFQTRMHFMYYAMNLKHQMFKQNLHVPGESRKYTHLMSHNTTFSDKNAFHVYRYLCHES